MGSLENNNQIIRIDRNLLLDPTMCDAYMDGVYLCLTPNEFNILFCMAQKPGHAFSRQELYIAAFGHDDPKSHRVLDSHIKNIRKKMPATLVGLRAFTVMAIVSILLLDLSLR